MNDQTTDAEREALPGSDAEAGNADLVLEYELDAPPEKVWRAITIPELRETWLPGRDLSEADPLVKVPGEEVTYRMTEGTPPYFESVVAFRLRPDGTGGTILRIVHRLTDARLMPQVPKAANSNEPVLMLAA